jgi:putative transposase
MKKRFSEEQIIRVPKESEAGAKTPELCRKRRISEATFYNWKSKYGGMTVSDARRLKELEAENSKLKRLLAEAELDKAALKDLLSRKWWAHGSDARRWTCCGRNAVTASPGPVGWWASLDRYMATGAAGRPLKGW